MWGWQGPFKSRFKKENDNPESIKGKIYPHRLLIIFVTATIATVILQYLFCVVPYLKCISVTWVWSGPNSGVAHCLYYFCVHKTIIEVDFGHKKTFMIHS